MLYIQCLTTGEVIDALNQLLTPYGGAKAYGREDQLSHRMLHSEIREQQVLGTVLPGIFLLVAAFLLQTVMTLHIGLQREQIAALKALPAVFTGPTHALTTGLIVLLALGFLALEAAGLKRRLEPYHLSRHPALCCLFVFLIVLLAPMEESSFIYFNF